MLSKTYALSARKYEVKRHRGIRIPVSAGLDLACEIVRPVTGERVPVILCVMPFNMEKNFATAMPRAISGEWVAVEGGDPNFYGRRGYAQAFVSLRGTGDSGGTFDHMGPGTIRDIYEVIEWLAAQHWCDGQVATFGTSYFSMPIKLVAQLRPPSLKAIFAPFGVDDQYRQAIFHGGILSFKFHRWWFANILDKPRYNREFKSSMDPEEWHARVQAALQDPEIACQPDLVDALNNDDSDANLYLVDYLLNPLCNERHMQRSAQYCHDQKIPAYFGGCWGMHMLHLPGDFQSYVRWTGPKKLTIGPPYYLDRPLYQYANESLRFFDHWLKGIDTGLMDEAPVQLFIRNTGDWKEAHEWPIPGTRWTEFYLHDGGLLSEHELFPDDSATSFTDSMQTHGEAVFMTPPMVENTELCGPAALHVWARTTDTDLLWFVTLLQVDADGSETVLTRGWLRGSQRRVDPARSTPWQPFHPHDRRESLTPGEATLFNIEIVPLGVLLKSGMRLKLKLKASDEGDALDTFTEMHAAGHLLREGPATITILHDVDHPSHLLLPITHGNRLGTFMSGGVMPKLSSSH